MKTVLITDEFAGRDGASQSLANAALAANAVVTAGNANMIVTLLPMQRLIGYDEYANVIAEGGGSLKPDGSIELNRRSQALHASWASIKPEQRPGRGG